MKKIITTMLAICLAWSLSGCNSNKEITLELSYGEQTGEYSGDVNEQGLPHGQGKFISQDENGETWTYEGEFNNGHFNGEGKITWDNGTIDIGTFENDVIIPMKDDEIKSMFSVPENFKDHYVEFLGRVFVDPEFDENGIYLQVFTDIEAYTNNAIIYINNKNLDIQKNDYIHIIGKVGEVIEGENSFGGIVTAPMITGIEYEVLSYQEALMPTLKTIDVNETQKQYGYSITLQKIEFAEKETRVYLKIDNKGSDTLNVYTFNAKITQSGKQFDEQSNYDAEYPEIQSDLLVGNSTEGIIAFPKINDGEFTVVIDASSENYNEDIKPFKFNVQNK